jgi:hypothetical protein
VINHKQSNDLPLDGDIRVVSDPLHFMNILIWENNHKILLDIKRTKRDQFLRITQVSVTRAVTMSALFLIRTIRRSIVISDCSLEFDHTINKLLILFNDVQTSVITSSEENPSTCHYPEYTECGLISISAILTIARISVSKFT